MIDEYDLWRDHDAGYHRDEPFGDGPHPECAACASDESPGHAS